MKTLKFFIILLFMSLLISCADDKCHDSPDTYFYLQNWDTNMISYKHGDTNLFQNKTGGKITCVLYKIRDSFISYNTQIYCTKHQQEIFQTKCYYFTCIEDTNYNFLRTWDTFEGRLFFDKITYGGSSFIDTLTVSGKLYFGVFRKSAKIGLGPFFYYTYKDGIIKIETYKTDWERIN